MVQVTIIKRNGERVDFDKAKIARVVLAAGASKEDAHKVSENVRTWIDASGKDTFTTVQIRDQVLVQLQKIDHEASRSFVEYEMFRDRQLGSAQVPGTLTDN